MVEAGSFGKAALRLHISQLALSGQIWRLEPELGATLLVRSHRGVEPTAACELLLREGARLLAGAAALQRRVRRARRRWPPGPARRIPRQRRGGADPAAGSRLRRARRRVELDLHEFHFAEPLLGLADGSSDAALLRLPIDGAASLETLDLFAEQRVAVLPINHPLAKRDTVRVAELLEEPCVTGSHGAFRDFLTLQAHRDSPAPVAIEGGTVAEWWSAVASGRAICASPASAERYDKRPELAFVPIADAAPSVCALAWHPGEVGPELAA